MRSIGSALVRQIPSRQQHLELSRVHIKQELLTARLFSQAELSAMTDARQKEQAPGDL